MKKLGVGTLVSVLVVACGSTELKPSEAPELEPEPALLTDAEAAALDLADPCFGLEESACAAHRSGACEWFAAPGADFCGTSFELTPSQDGETLIATGKRYVTHDALAHAPLTADELKLKAENARVTINAYRARAGLPVESSHHTSTYCGTGCRRDCLSERCLDWLNTCFHESIGHCTQTECRQRNTYKHCGTPGWACNTVTKSHYGYRYCG